MQDTARPGRPGEAAPPPQRVRPRSRANLGDDVAELERLTDAMLLASRVLVGISVRSLNATDDHLTLPQLRFLVVLCSRGPCSIKEIGAELAVNKSSASRLCDRLVRAGLVVRETNPDDRREVIVTATPQARRTVELVDVRRREQIAELLRAMPASRRRSLDGALRAFAAAADEPAERDWRHG